MENPFDIITQRLNRIEMLLEKLSISVANQKELNGGLDQISGIKLAEEVTGLARASIYGLVCKKSIPCFKKGKKLYFSRLELIDWIKSGRCKTKSEIIQEVELQQIKSFKSRI
jgi:hypothetical protein